MLPWRVPARLGATTSLSDGSGTRRRTQPLRGTDRSIVDRFYLAPALFRLGELYEHAGDAKHAAEYYGRFVKLWKNIDSRFQI